MRKFQPASWAFAAVLAVALAGAPSARAVSGSATVRLLREQLPPGVTLASASIGQTADALGAAVSAHPDMAPNLTEVAVVAKTPKRGQGTLSCRSLTRIVRAAVDAAPQKSSDTVQAALSMHPECADSLSALTGSAPVRNGPDGFQNPTDEYGGFGVGFGPGFPGSPGFVGSPPSGAIALPPGATATPTPVTTAVNG